MKQKNRSFRSNLLQLMYNRLAKYYVTIFIFSNAVNYLIKRKSRRNKCKLERHAKFFKLIIKCPKTAFKWLQKQSDSKSSFNKLGCFPYLYKDPLSSFHLLDLKVDSVLFLKRFYPRCLMTDDLGPNPRIEFRTTLTIQSATYQPAIRILASKNACTHFFSVTW